MQSRRHIVSFKIVPINDDDERLPNNLVVYVCITLRLDIGQGRLSIFYQIMQILRVKIGTKTTQKKKLVL